jgi:DNA-binding MarR family transcriptional regulator
VSVNRGLPRRVRIPEVEGEPRPLPRRLLKHPSAVMFFVMREAFRLSQKRAAEEQGSAETMRFPQYAVLACLAEFGPGSQREISDRLRFDPSDVVTFVDGLEQAGWVARKRDPRDRRRYALELTPAGRRALQRRDRSAQQLNRQLFGALNEKEFRLFRDLLLRVLSDHNPRAGSGGD